MDIQGVKTALSNAGGGSGRGNGSPLGDIAGSFAGLLEKAGVRLDMSAVSTANQFARPNDPDAVRVADKGERRDPDDGRERAEAPAGREDRFAARHEERREPAVDDRRSTRDDAAETRPARRDDAPAEPEARDASGESGRNRASDAPAEGADEARSDVADARSEKADTGRPAGDDTPATPAAEIAKAAPAAQTQGAQAGDGAFNQALANLVQTARSGGDGGAVKEAAHQVAAATPQHTKAGAAPEAGADPNLSGESRGQGQAKAGAQASTPAQAQARGHAQGGEAAAAARTPDAATLQAGGREAPSTQQQAAALSRAIQPERPVQVQVNVADEASTVVSQPSQVLSGRSAAGNGGAGQQSGGQQAQHGHPGQPGPNAAAMMGGAGNGNATPAQAGPQTQSAQSFAAALGGTKAGAASAQPAAATASQPAAPLGGEAATATPAAPGQPGHGAPAQHAAKSQAPHAPRPAFQPQSAVDQVSVNVLKAIKGGADRINIQLRPESMGRVEVRIEVGHNGHVQTHVIADKPETLDMLQRDARGLEQALRDAGLNPQSGGMNFSLRGGQNGAPHGHDGRGSGQPGGNEDIAADEPVPPADAAPVAESVSGTGGEPGRVDIRA